MYFIYLLFLYIFSNAETYSINGESNDDENADNDEYHYSNTFDEAKMQVD